MKHGILQQVSAYGLPIGVLIIIPLFILILSSDFVIGWPLLPIINIPLLVIGMVSILSGLTLLYVTIRMFYRIGRGTLAPWAPTEELIVDGLYSRSRSPMISGVLLVLFGEFLVFSSLWIFIWFVVFAIGNHFYFIRFEEPGLMNRFGSTYKSYKENVPRWIPRRTSWVPDQPSEKT